MVDNEIYDHLNAPVVGFVQEVFKVAEGAVIGVDGSVVRYVVFVVAGRGTNGHQPHGSNPQFLQVIKPGSYAVDVPNAVTVGISERLNKDFVEDSVGVGQKARVKLLR